MSFLRHDADPHARFRALLSQRLDERLPAEASRALRRHLLGCARCRATDRDFRSQRVLLRASRPALPPRDLWARTSAALDREVARGGRSGVSREPRESRGRSLRGSSPRVAAASVVGLMLVVAVVGNQLSSGGGGTGPSLVAVGPTPFTVPTQELAFVGQDANGFAIYRTEVSQICPAQSIDCTTVVSGNRQVVYLRGEEELRPSSVAFHPQRDKVAIAAQGGRGESVYVVYLKPVAGRGTGQTAGDTPRPPASLATASLTPLTPAPATPAATTVDPGSSSAVVPGSDDPSGKPTHAPPSGPGTTLRPGRTPRPTQGDASPSPSTATTPAPTPPTATPPAATPPSIAIVTASPNGDLPTDVQPILQDVLAAGAEPAWSPDGDILAFSAMPADGSQGPDIYIWHTGDAKAERLTEDHRSYFASWAGNRIVASRSTRATALDGRALSTDLRVVNVVIDLRTGEQRRIDARGLWLPLVDPTERFAIVWRGDLVQVGEALEPVKGALYLADWRRLDPFRVAVVDRPSRIGEDGVKGARTPADAVDPLPKTAPPSTEAASPGPTASPAASAAASPKGRRSRRTPSPSTPEPSTRPTASPTPEATSPPTSSPTPASTAAPTPDAVSDALPVEPGREVDREPVLDWVGRWNTEGDAYGFWISETRGGSWGRLTVVSVDRSSGRISSDSTLLRPTLAKRMFSLGQDRVAWVAPVDDQPDGELRVRTWGPNGSGTVRIRDVNAGEGAPAF